MITLIEAKNFRSLKYISCYLSPFNVLVGPNGSGKTTFFDVFSFISEILKEKSITKVIKNRVDDFNLLTFACQGGDIELAVEAAIPLDLKANLWDKEMDSIRYEICFGLSLSGNVAIKEEKVVIFNNKILENRTIVATLFPDDSKEMGLILNKFFPPKGYRQTVKKNLNNKASYSDEISISRGKGWVQSIEFEEDSCAFSYLYGKKESFAVTRWFFKLLTDNVQSFVLDSLELRKASPPKYAASFQLDGTNLPWNVRNLKQTNPKKFKSWVEHVQTAIKGLQDIDAISREDDKHCYLKLSFEGGIKIPSWLVSDGTLRLMAFTILAYLPNLQKTFLIEEPENGIHPKNMEIVFESLSNVKNSQVFLATHSPAIISLLALESLLCFSKTSNGVTDILRGDAHPQLIKWKGEVSLDILHAGGVLE